MHIIWYLLYIYDIGFKNAQLERMIFCILRKAWTTVRYKSQYFFPIGNCWSELSLGWGRAACQSDRQPHCGHLQPVVPCLSCLGRDCCCRGQLGSGDRITRWLNSVSKLLFNTYKFNYWKCNFPLTPPVRLLVGLSRTIIRSLDRTVEICDP